MTSLQTEIRNCQRCDLCATLPPTVKPMPGAGPLNANIMIILESPSEDEMIFNSHLSGLNGKYLNQLFDSAGIRMEECYITHAVKCSTNKRPLKSFQIHSCSLWIAKEMKTISPKIIVGMGKVAGRILSGRNLVKFSEHIGTINNKSTYTYILTWHPSYLLQGSRLLSEETIQHLKLAREYINGIQT